MYCSIPRENAREIPLEKVYSLIAEMKTLGTKMISFMGGEPLLRDDLGQILDNCKKNGIATSIFTNGVLLPERIGEISSCDKVVISIDGDEEANDLVRGKGSYQKAMHAVSSARKKNIDVLLHCVLTKYNLHCLEFLVKKAKEVGARVRFQPVSHMHARARNISSLLPPAGKFKEAIERLVMLKNKGAAIENSRGSLDYLLSWPSCSIWRKCVGGKIYCYISTAGEMYPCSEMQGSISAFNCLEVGVRKAFGNICEESLQDKCTECFLAAVVDLNLAYNFHRLNFKA